MTKFIYCLLFISFYLCAMQNQEKELMVITSDHKMIRIPEKYLLLSNVMRKVLKDCLDINGPIPLPSISGQELTETLPYLKNSFILQYKKSSNVLIQKANSEFLALNSQDKLYKVLCAANYLNIPFLLKKCMKLWAENKFSPTKKYPLPSEIDTGIARFMPRSKKLINDVAQWVVNDFEKRQVSLLKKTYEQGIGSIWSNAFNANGEMLAGGAAGGDISLYNLDTNHTQVFQSGHENVSLLKFHANDSQIWSSGGDNSIKVWDIKNRSVYKTFQSPFCKAFVFCYMPRSSILIADGINHNLCIWDLANKKRDPELLDAHSGIILLLESSPDDSLFVSGGCDKKVLLWDSTKKKKLTSFDYDSSVMSACFNHQKMQLISGLSNGKIVAYDLVTGKKMYQKKGHDSGIWSILPSDENDILLCTGSKDTLIKLWDLRTKTPVAYFSDHKSEIQYMAINHKKGLLSSASHDHSMMLWDLRKLTNPIKTLQKEFSKKTTIKQINLLEDIDKSSKTLDLNINNRLNIFKQFSPEAQKLFINNLNIAKQ